MIRIHFAIILLSTLIMFSCNSNHNNKDGETSPAQNSKLNENYVDTMSLFPTTFNQQIICNGKLRAHSKSEITFPIQGMITSIHAKNGNLVKKGMLLATIDKLDYAGECQQAERELKKAKIDLIDKLIGLGYDNDLKKVPHDLLERTKITTSFATAEYKLETAKRNLAKCNLYAPFSGRVANMNCKLYQKAEVFCTLIDDSWFDVEFSILESELSSIKKGQAIRVSPFIDDDLNFGGIITGINPIVDEKGQIKVTAKIHNKNNYLMEGMNVKVVVEEQMNNMYVVPKDAVVIRDGYPVVFILKNGKAEWTYVDILSSNISYHVIAGNREKDTHLKTGDIIITSGNLNLADGTQVIPRGQK